MHLGHVNSAKVYTAREAAALLRVGYSTLVGLLVRNEVQGAKVGGQWRVYGSALLAAMTVRAATPAPAPGDARAAAEAAEVRRRIAELKARKPRPVRKP